MKQKRLSIGKTLFFVWLLLSFSVINVLAEAQPVYKLYFPIAHQSFVWTFTPTVTRTPTKTVTRTLTLAPTRTSTPTKTTNPLNLEVDFIDVGQGDSILILTSDGKVALIDGGNRGTTALQYLQGKNINHIDLMIATHPHSDHIGGLINILNSIPVTKVVTNGQAHTTQTYEDFLDAIINSQAVYDETSRGETIPFGNFSFAVLAPVSATGSDLNNNSLVLRLVYNQISFLFMGDAEFEEESSIMSSGLPISANILKVGHHGSSTSSSPSFLALVHPLIAVYSAGVGNPYGHPSAQTITNLRNAGATVYGTDVNGSIRVITNGVTYNVYTQK